MSEGIEFDEAAAKGLERVYESPDRPGQRSRVTEAHALRRYERVLDVGIGPGLLAYDVADNELGELWNSSGPLPLQRMASCRSAANSGLRLHSRCTMATEIGHPDGCPSTERWIRNQPVEACLLRVRALP